MPKRLAGLYTLKLYSIYPIGTDAISRRKTTNLSKKRAQPFQFDIKTIFHIFQEDTDQCDTASFQGVYRTMRGRPTTRYFEDVSINVRTINLSRYKNSTTTKNMQIQSETYSNDDIRLCSKESNDLESPVYNLLVNYINAVSNTIKQPP